MNAADLFRPNTKAHLIVSQPEDASIDDIVAALKAKGIKSSRQHIYAVRTAAKRRLEDHLRKTAGKANGHGSADAAKQSAAGVFVPPLVGLSAMERELLRIATDIGFGRAATLLEQYRGRVHAMIGSDDP